jgi:hypothetical protein
MVYDSPTTAKMLAFSKIRVLSITLVTVAACSVTLLYTTSPTFTLLVTNVAEKSSSAFATTVLLVPVSAMDNDGIYALSVETMLNADVVCNF